jgi:hypothetical protein
VKIRGLDQVVKEEVQVLATEMSVVEIEVVTGERVALAIVVEIAEGPEQEIVALGQIALEARGNQSGIDIVK